MNSKTFGGSIVLSVVGLLTYGVVHHSLGTIDGALSEKQEEGFQQQIQKAQQERDPVRALRQLPANISQNSRSFQIAQRLKGSLSRQVLNDAQSLYRRGEIDRAITRLRQIPLGTPITSEAQLLTRTWTTEAAQLRAARQSMSQGRWEQAVQEIEALRGSEVFSTSVVENLLQKAIAGATPNIVVAQTPLQPPSFASIPNNLPNIPPAPKPPTSPEIQSALKAGFSFSTPQTPESSSFKAVASQSNVVPPPPTLAQSPRTALLPVPRSTMLPPVAQNTRIPAPPNLVPQATTTVALLPQRIAQSNTLQQSSRSVTPETTLPRSPNLILPQSNPAIALASTTKSFTKNNALAQAVTARSKSNSAHSLNPASAVVLSADSIQEMLDAASLSDRADQFPIQSSFANNLTLATQLMSRL